MRGSTLRRFAASSRLWIDDDADPRGRAGMAGDWPHRHAVRLSEPGSPRAGGAQAQPHGRWSFQGGQIEPIPIPANWHANIAEWAFALCAVHEAKGTFRSATGVVGST